MVRRGPFDRLISWLLLRLWVAITCPSWSPYLELAGKCDKPRWHEGDHHCAGRTWR